MTTHDKTVTADWFRIAEAFASKQNSTPEDVIRLVSGLRAEFESPNPKAAAATEEEDKNFLKDIPARPSRTRSQAEGPKPAAPATPKSAPRKPAIPIEKAVSDDLVFCLECGRGMKMLKRHLGSTHGMKPHEYRARWDLPEDFPITAPNYTAEKSSTAKAMEFGKGSSKNTTKSGRKAKPNA